MFFSAKHISSSVEKTQLIGMEHFFFKIIWCYMCMLPYYLRVSKIFGQNGSSSIISGPLSGASCKRKLLDWAAEGEEKTYRC